MKPLTAAQYRDLMQAPISIAGIAVRFAEPSIARMDGINQLIALDGYDIWSQNPATFQPLYRMLLTRFDGNNGRIKELFSLCLSDVPEDLEIEAVTGLELGALLQGFFIYYHVRAGTIDLAQKQLPLQLQRDELLKSTSPTSKKSSAGSKNRRTGCSPSRKSTGSSPQTLPEPDSEPTQSCSNCR